jgi:hypothetical protein
MVPIKEGGQLWTNEEPNFKEHQIIIRRIGDYPTNVVFHHNHISIPFDKINEVSGKAPIKKGISGKCVPGWRFNNFKTMLTLSLIKHI